MFCLVLPLYTNVTPLSFHKLILSSGILFRKLEVFQLTTFFILVSEVIFNIEIPLPLLCSNNVISGLLNLLQIQDITLSRSYNSLEKLLFPKDSKSLKSEGLSNVVPL